MVALLGEVPAGRLYATAHVERGEIMALERTAGIGFCIIITSAIAAGEPQRNSTAQRPLEPGTRVLAPTYWAGDVPPLRRVQTRTESDNRQVVVETVEGLDIEGRVAVLEEVVTDTSRSGSETVEKQDVFLVTPDGRRRLAETTESRQLELQAAGRTSVHNTWTPDLNGGLRLTARLIEERRSPAPDVQRTDTTLLLPDVNQGLREAERTEHTAQRISSEVVRHDQALLVRDINGQWRPVEVRRGEVRDTGSTERVEEETVQRPDLSGNMSLAETNVIRRSRTKDQEHEVIETYAPQTDVRGTNGRPPLSERLQRTTTATADGGRYTVEELEARSRISPNEPMRVVRRVVTTVSPNGAGEFVTVRQVFELDVNGRMRLVRTE
jgi:hypothetical protein